MAIVPPPKTKQGAEERIKEKHAECKDWYFCKYFFLSS